jgi:deazaflavin-dependent oxidoreductase (nitroreductase family)
MRQGWFKRGYLRVLARTINPLALAAARSTRGPFSALRHVGRRSGRTYETPLILAPVDDGFVAELTYGSDVAWCRNLAANGRGELVVNGTTYRVTGIEPYPASAGLAAYPQPQRTILKLLRRTEFRLITVADAAAGAGRPDGRPPP